MMKTAVRPATSQATSTDTCTATESLNLMKNLLSCGLSCITYLRNLFDEGTYDDCPQNGLMLKSLKRNVSKEANNLIDWLELGCFDALEKQYLRKVVLGVYLNVKNPEIMEEVYEFNVTYPGRNSDGPLLSIRKDHTDILQVYTKKEIKKATQQMMRTLLTLTQTLKPLPDERIVTMRLYYYDDVTPVDYQPPLFRDTVDVKLNFRKEDPVKIIVGKVDTPFHTLNVKIQANVDSFEDEESDEAKEGKAGSDGMESEDSPPMHSPKPSAQIPDKPSDPKPAAKAVPPQSSTASTPASKAKANPPKQKAPKSKKKSDGDQVDDADKENVQPANLSQDMDTDDPEVPDSEAATKVQAVTQQGESSKKGAVSGKAASKTPATSASPSGPTPAPKSSSEAVPATTAAASPNQLAASPEKRTKRAPEKYPVSAISRLEKSSANPQQQQQQQKQQQQKQQQRQSAAASHSQGSDSPSEVVNCLCGDKEEDLGMVQCEACEGWNHVLCLGFEDEHDPRIPETFTCFVCVAKKKTSKSPSADELKKASDLALWRRSLSLVYKEGLTMPVALAKRLSVEPPVAHGIYARMEVEGFLKKLPLVKNACFVKSYSLARSSTVMQKYEAYFSGNWEPVATPEQPLTGPVAVMTDSNVADAPVGGEKDKQKAPPSPRTPIRKKTQAQPPTPSSKKRATVPPAITGPQKKSPEKKQGKRPASALEEPAGSKPSGKGSTQKSGGMDVEDNNDETQDEKPAPPLTPKKQPPPSAAAAAVGRNGPAPAPSDLNDKLNKLGLGESGLPGGLPPYLSQYGVANDSPSQSDADEGSRGDASTSRADERPKKVRKVSVVNRPLKV